MPISANAVNKGGRAMKEYMVFIHEPESAMVRKVELIRARSRRAALKKLQRMGFKKRRF